MNENQWCWFCGAKADLLCDGHLGWLKLVDLKRAPYPVIDTRNPAKSQFTCDRPLCRACVVKTTPISMRTTKGCEFHSWDYCADCVKEERDNFGGQINNGMQRPQDLFTMEEGHAIQKRRHFQTVKPINDLDRALARIKELESILAATAPEPGSSQEGA
jgi:hypothetical protein